MKPVVFKSLLKAFFRFYLFLLTLVFIRNVSEKSQLAAVSKQFVDLFAHALTYRSRQEATSSGPTEGVETAEAAIITAFLAVTLR